MLVEMRFLDPLGLDRIDVEQPLDISTHALVDQLEQAGRRWVKAIVEVRSIAYDRSGGPCAAARNGSKFLSKLKHS
jgi:hypothetical protein